MSEVNSNLIILYRYSKKDCDRVFKEILERLNIPPHHVRYSSSKNQIVIDGLITFKFYSGDIYHIAGIGNVLFNSDSSYVSLYLESRGCFEIKDIYHFVDYLVEELKSPI